MIPRKEQGDTLYNAINWLAALWYQISDELGLVGDTVLPDKTHSGDWDVMQWMISGKLDYESDAMISRLKNKSACDTLISVNYTVEYYAMISGEL